MKMPKKQKRYCPKCKKNTEQKVSREKTSGNRGKLGKGRRKLAKIKKGYGGFPYPKIEKGNRYGSKNTKKVALKYECPVCKKKTISKRGFRAKKFEME